MSSFCRSAALCRTKVTNGPARRGEVRRDATRRDGMGRARRDAPLELKRGGGGGEGGRLSAVLCAALNGNGTPISLGAL